MLRNCKLNDTELLTIKMKHTKKGCSIKEHPINIGDDTKPFLNPDFAFEIQLQP